jgi:bacteriorhodopsin
VAVVGEGILFVLSAMVGAATVAPVKYMWWFASALFGVLVIIHLVQRIPEGSHEIHKHLTYLTIVSLVVYSLLWLLGSEGTAALGLSQEVTFLFVYVANCACTLCQIHHFECSSITSHD